MTPQDYATIPSAVLLIAAPVGLLLWGAHRLAFAPRPDRHALDDSLDDIYRKKAAEFYRREIHVAKAFTQREAR